jgi:UPF0716 protein FxsA
MRALLVVVFLVVPVIELAIIVQVGELIGAAWTILALLAVSLAGAWLVRREGTRAWSRFRTALASGRVPTDEVVEGALVLFGGALLLTPGFATDAVGLSLMVPPVRAFVAGTLRRRLGARFVVGTVGGGGATQRPGPAQRPPSLRRDDVVDVEVVSIERTPGPPEAAAQNGDIHNRDSGSA